MKSFLLNYPRTANVAGYIARQIQKRIKCVECATKVEARDKNTIHSSYINLLSRGGLKHPSPALDEYVANTFAILDVSSRIIIRYSTCTPLKSNMLAMEVLNNFNNNVNFACEKHIDAARRISARAVVNVFFNNQRIEKSAQVRKQKVAAFKKRQRTKKAKGED